MKVCCGACCRLEGKGDLNRKLYLPRDTISKSKVVNVLTIKEFAQYQGELTPQFAGENCSLSVSGSEGRLDCGWEQALNRSSGGERIHIEGLRKAQYSSTVPRL